MYLLRKIHSFVSFHLSKRLYQYSKGKNNFIFRLLLRIGADPNSFDPKIGLTPLR